ncbi:hypothetical protein EHO60_04910 [Leptospira fletcheri]|uniref:Uncharacterized protein n=1 Tax=Leptospira fletcheri TaxID=2484981 RepID=A0A4R9GH29_9LEPT|nr:hypothetical protein [Leptospira fletcheri]TGK11641.1 hypothetical protein EHO60_04910 [Leptospira fletcheri]
MSQITQFFSNLKADFDRLSQSIDNLVKTYNAIVDFLELVSSIFPLDLVLVLLFSIPLLVVFNSLSPSSPRINYTIAVLAVSGIRSFLQHSISESWDLFATVKTAVILLLPAYGFLLSRFLVGIGRRVRLRKRALAPRNLEESFTFVQASFRSLAADLYQELESAGDSSFVDGEKLLPALQNLEESLKGLRRTLEGNSST